MQRVFWVLVLLNVLLISAAAFLLPERIVSHFDLAGQPNGWTSKVEFVAIFVLTLFIEVIVWVPIAFLVTTCPPELINIPNKDYWVRDNNILQLHKIFSFWWWGMGCIAMVFDLYLSLEIIQTNLMKTPVLSNGIWFAAILFTLLLGVSIVYLFLSLRVPKEDT
jgi:hypothetical protein